MSQKILSDFFASKKSAHKKRGKAPAPLKSTKRKAEEACPIVVEQPAKKLCSVKANLAEGSKNDVSIKKKVLSAVCSSKLTDVKANNDEANLNPDKLAERSTSSATAKVAGEVEEASQKSLLLAPSEAAAVEENTERKEAVKKLSTTKPCTQKVEKRNSVEGESVEAPSFSKQHLREKNKANNEVAVERPGLVLPFRYRRVLEVYTALDNVLCFLHNRDENATFGKLQRAVQSVTSRNFEHRQLGQLITICCGNLKVYLMAAAGNKKQELTVEPVLEKDDNGSEELTKEGRIVFSARHLVQRKRQVYQYLLKKTMEAHQEFLRSQTRITISDSELRSWHADFPLEMVPNIVPAELPKPKQSTCVTSAVEVLKAVKERMHAKSSATKKLLSTRRLETTSLQPDKDNAANSNKDGDKGEEVKNVNPALRGLPSTLLEKVRAREAARMSLLMRRPPEAEKRRDTLQRLTRLTSILRSVFVAEKKPALPLDIVAKRLADGYKLSMTVVSAVEHIEEAASTCAFWLQLLKTSKGRYVRLDINVELSRVSAELNKVIDSI